jgi:tRNA-Thr(GGU) m(6)t(6)A37 methyltransferase TsaA
VWLGDPDGYWAGGGAVAPTRIARCLMVVDAFVVRPVGFVSSPLESPAEAPLQGDEGTVEAWVLLEPDASPAAADLGRGDRVVLLTWLHLADRDVLSVHPRDDQSRPLTGVFSTRSQDRPNPIGLHEVEILAVQPDRFLVRGLEAIHGTPVVDIKPVLQAVSRR